MAEFHTIPAILDDLRAGKMIVLVDDEHRENEGDLVCAAQFVTAEVTNFMLREARGMLCLSLAGKICDRLELNPQTPVSTALRGTAYTVSVDAQDRFGITTGVSAADRARTICVVIDGATGPSDLVRPGHIQPLRARDGGVLVRAGQTEGSVDLCKLAGLRPGAVIIEIMNDDGTMARQGDLALLCKKHDWKMCAVADVIHYRLEREQLVHRIDSVPFENELGRFTLIAYQSEVDPFPHVVLACGDVGRLDPTGFPIVLDEPVLVRMHSQNLLGDVFGDREQSSGRTLMAAMRRIQQEGCGALVYLRHAGMGSGLLKRLQTPRPMSDEPAVRDEFVRLGSGQPTSGIRPSTGEGAYGIGSQILRDLGIRKLRLLTNHPFHPTALAGFGLSISSFEPVTE